MGMDKTDINAIELAEILRTDIETLRGRFRRAYPGQSWDSSAVLSAEQRATLSAGRSAKKSVRKSAPRQAGVAKNATTEMQDNSTTETQAAPLFNTAYLKAIVYGHAILIFADLIILYAIPGLIAGLLVGLFMHSAVGLADRPELNRTSSFALWVCALLDGLAWFVHVPAFRDSVSADVSDSVTQTLAFVVCAMSFAALYALRDSNLIEK